MSGIHFDSDKIKNRFMESEQEAADMLKNPTKVQKALTDALAKLSNINDGPIKKIFEDISLLINITKDWISGRYREVPYGTVVAILGALIYFVSPIDFIPDFIPGVGFLDDAFVIGLVLKQADADLQTYKKWKENN